MNWRIAAIVAWAKICLCISQPILYAEEARAFAELGDRVAIAEPVMAKLFFENWRPIPVVWMPTIEEGHEAFIATKAQLETGELLALTGELHEKTRKVESSVFQLFGLTYKGRKCIYIDVTPINRFTQKQEYLTKILSRGVIGGGRAYWFVIYDVEHKKFVKGEQISIAVDLGARATGFFAESKGEE